MNAWLATALVLGLAGSAHCVGMCGPIALAVPSHSNKAGARWASTILLNGGRLTTYALLGAAVGVLGLGLHWAGLGRVVSMAGGALLLLSVIVPGLLVRWWPTGRLAMGIGRLRGALARNLRRTAPEALFLTGMLNGLLPCGLVYAAMLGAATMASPGEGALFMAAFGMGTWPALVALRMGGGLLGSGTRAWLRNLSPVLMAAMGLLLILRGLELGIPFISPGPMATHATAVGCP
ncbi:MAG: sulfite exporter TauE/SafE family protein [Flavobacteriales bacterium]|nr:sulfite exporter TauE/SafE family protein [Flavobacteriales bacterium]